MQTESPEDVVAHLVHYVSGLNIGKEFSKFPDSQIRIILLTPELSEEADKLSEICFENSAEIFVWHLEDDVAPGPRLRQILECHPWSDLESAAPEISFEDLLAEIHRVKELCGDGNLSDDARRELAAATALKFARLLGDDDLCLSD